MHCTVVLPVQLCWIFLAKVGIASIICRGNACTFSTAKAIYMLQMHAGLVSDTASPCGVCQSVLTYSEAFQSYSSVLLPGCIERALKLPCIMLSQDSEMLVERIQRPQRSLHVARPLRLRCKL